MRIIYETLSASGEYRSTRQDTIIAPASVYSCYLPCSVPIGRAEALFCCSCCPDCPLSNSSPSKAGPNWLLGVQDRMDLRCQSLPRFISASVTLSVDSTFDLSPLLPLSKSPSILSLIATESRRSAAMGEIASHSTPTPWSLTVPVQTLTILLAKK